MASQMYDEAALRLVIGGSGSSIAVLSDTIKVLLLTAYTPSKGHQFVTDVLGAGTELSTTNYARKTLASPSISKDGTNHQIVYTFANPTWTALGPATGGPTVIGAVIFKDTGSDSTAPVIAWLDPADITVNGGDLTLTFDATNGAFRLTI